MLLVDTGSGSSAVEHDVLDTVLEHRKGPNGSTGGGTGTAGCRRAGRRSSARATRQ